ncbi:MAG: GMC family oxidoreductase [Blastocatellia bacterium]|nr:GMC family oxidoreductase [Blastocatellia bacterium]
MWSQKRAAARQPVYDVVIVGSGAAGGTAAWTLVNAGLRVAMLDAGPLRKNLEDFPYHATFPYDDPYRGMKTPLDRSEEFMKKYSITGSSPEEPYTAPEKTPYEWFRARNIGGRTMFWGRFCNRFNEADFKMRSRDGGGLDWPIEYKDLAPYYDKTELFMGVTGQAENHPDLPDGKYMPPVAMKCPDVELSKAGAKLGIRAIRARRAQLTTSYKSPSGTFAPCHYCGECQDGCETHSFYNSAFRQVVPLMEKFPARFKLIPNAMAHKINLNAKGLASSVGYVDRATGKSYEVKARAVIAACGTLESTRLLLASGIANSSGMIGRNFIEHLDATAEGYLPSLFNTTREEGDGLGGSHIIFPWFGYFRPNEKRDFLRGFQIEPSARQSMRPLRRPKTVAGFGPEYKKEIRKWQSGRVRLAAHGEMLANPNKFVELDPNVKDKWGLPVLKINYPWDANDLAMFKYLRQTFEEILGAAKAVEVKLPKTPDIAGHSIHEMGTIHMGSDPKTSVLNSFNQSWDVKNLFVTDGAAFSSGTHKNPTLTIMALSMRAADYILAQMKKGNL